MYVLLPEISQHTNLNASFIVKHFTPVHLIQANLRFEFLYYTLGNRMRLLNKNYDQYMQPNYTSTYTKFMCYALVVFLKIGCK